MKTFIQIGAGAGDRDASANFIDGFTRMVKAEDPALVERVIVVEPNPVNTPFLRECWQDYPQAEIHTLGIVPSSHKEKNITFYYDPTDGPHYQMTSILRTHRGSDNLLEFSAPCLTLTEFLSRTVDTHKVDVLALDIEGIDGDVIIDTDWRQFDIDLLSFEYTNLGNQIDQVVQHLKDSEFEHIGIGLDQHGLDWMYQKRK